MELEIYEVERRPWVLKFDGSCGDPRARSDPVGGSEPKPRGHLVTIVSLYQNHLSNTRRSNFKLGRAHKNLTKYIYNEGIPSLFKMVVSEFKLFLQNINVQKKWSECICQSILHNSFFMTLSSSTLGPPSITINHSVPAH